MTPARLLTEQNVTRNAFSWPYRQTDQGVRPYNATRGPFGAHQNVAKRGNSVRATPSLHPHARKAGGKQKPFSNPKKGEPKPTRQTINFSGQLSSSPRSKIVVVEQSSAYKAKRPDARPHRSMIIGLGSRSCLARNLKKSRIYWANRHLDQVTTGQKTAGRTRNGCQSKRQRSSPGRVASSSTRPPPPAVCDLARSSCARRCPPPVWRRCGSSSGNGST